MIRTRTPQDGFTAVELLITLFVAAAFLIAGYQLFNAVLKDGGATRAESRAGNIAYDYLRRYSNSATNPCTTQSPLINQPVTVSDISDVSISIAITCPQPDETPTLSKVEATIAYGNPSESLKFATYVDKSKGASPNTEITDGLVSWWKFNGNINTSVGSANATNFGGAQFTTNRSGAVNSAMAFSAPSTQYLNAPSTFGLGNTNVTLTLWVYQATASASGQYMKVGNIGGYGLGIGNGNFDNVNPGPEIIGLFEGIRWIDTNTSLGTGWHFLAMTISSVGTPSIYRDGTLVGSYAGASAQSPSGDSTQIGGRSGSRYTTGSIDDVRVYNRALSASEIAQLNSGGPR